MSRSTPDRVVVVEVAAEAPLVPVARDPHDHPVPVPALREELERRRLAAELVLRVVEVREVLDLGHREEAAHRRSERETEDRCLVEQGVEDACGAEARVQSARDAVDAALHRDVLAEQQGLRVTLEHRRESRVDRLRERHRLVGRERDGAGGRCDRRGRARRERLHHLLRRAHLRERRRLERLLAHAVSRRLVLRCELLAGAPSRRRRATAQSRGAGPARSPRESRAESGTRSPRPLRHGSGSGRCRGGALRASAPRGPSRRARARARAPTPGRCRRPARNGSWDVTAARPPPTLPERAR